MVPAPAVLALEAMMLDGPLRVRAVKRSWKRIVRETIDADRPLVETVSAAGPPDMQAPLLGRP